MGPEKRDRLKPWYIGLVLTVGAVLFVGYRMWAGNCPAPGIVEVGVLTVIPIVYLAPMYLTFISQDWDDEQPASEGHDPARRSSRARSAGQCELAGIGARHFHSRRVCAGSASARGCGPVPSTVPSPIRVSPSRRDG